MLYICSESEILGFFSGGLYCRAMTELRAKNRDEEI
jgi:hypothetical protein